MNFKVLLFLIALTGARSSFANSEPTAPAHEAPTGHGSPTENSHGEKHEAPAGEFHGKVIHVRQVANDFRLPPTLWDQLLGHSQVKEVKASVEGREDEVQSSTILFAPVKVQFIEKNPGVLKQPAIEFQLPKGGGQIDLADIVTGQAGTFFVRFDLGEMAQASTFEAFHLSKGKKRKIDDRIYGGGCRSFAKITSVLAKYQKGQGLPFNTTEAIHVSALAGHFLFSTAEEDKTTVTQVKFIDSAHPFLFCQAEDQAKSSSGDGVSE